MIKPLIDWTETGKTSHLRVAESFYTLAGAVKAKRLRFVSVGIVYDCENGCDECPHGETAVTVLQDVGGGAVMGVVSSMGEVLANVAERALAGLKQEQEGENAAT